MFQIFAGILSFRGTSVLDENGKKVLRRIGLGLGNQGSKMIVVFSKGRTINVFKVSKFSH